MIHTLLCVTLTLCHVRGHGRLWEPPSRSTMWRRGYKTPHNYQDNELFCGGVGVQYFQNGGKCGVCGDPYNGVRENEVGGKYATGQIVRTYTVGQVIDVTIDLTANHKGYFEFNLCSSDNPQEKATLACLEQNPLEVLPLGVKRYNIPYPTPMNFMSMQVRLPAGVKCQACTFRWRYTAGNSWGRFPNGTECVGCGDQEQFYGCADIAVGYDEILPATTSKYVLPEAVKIYDEDTRLQSTGEAAPSCVPCEAATNSSRNSACWITIMYLFTAILVWSPTS